jgi:hypothetical protein
MGFGDARAGLVDALGAREFGVWARADAHRKNWLESRRISVEEVRAMLLRCNGRQHRESAHYGDASFLVHEFFPEWNGERWYVKAFFDTATSVWVFMSVHPAEGR